MSPLLAMLRRRLMTLWLWQALFVLAVIIGFVSTHIAEQTAMQRLRFVAMDSRSTFYLTSAGSFEAAQHIHAELAKLAAETIFSRSPDGFDDPDRLERLFNPFTTAKLKTDESRDADVFRTQKIHTKFECGPVKEVPIDSTTVLVSVEGQVLRTSTFNDRTVSESKKVTVFLRLKLNDEIAQNGRYPLVVTDFQTRFE